MATRDPKPKATDEGKATETASGRASAPVEVLRVRAHREGFRRAGRAWSVAETVVPVARLGEAEITALCTEPNLTVVRDTLTLKETR